MKIITLLFPVCFHIHYGAILFYDLFHFEKMTHCLPNLEIEYMHPV